MTNPIPPVDFEAPRVPASGYGLLAAATVFDTGNVTRELGGVRIWPTNCDTGVGTYSAAMCDPDPAVKTPGERAEPVIFDPMVVYAATECAPDQTEEEQLIRAQHLRALHEPLLVESHFAAQLLAEAPSPTYVPDLATAIGVLEEFLGEQGYQGYIHAARRHAAPLSQYRWTNETGAVLRSPLGHGYVFGGGYGSVLGNTLIATGPLYLWRSAPFDHVETTGRHAQAELGNTVYALSERVVTVGYECAIMAVTIGEPTLPGDELFPGENTFPGGN
jgi:hypothetical protein